MNNVISFNRLPLTPSNTESNLTAAVDTSPIRSAGASSHNTETHLRADPVARLVEERIRAWRAQAAHATHSAHSVHSAPPLLPLADPPGRGRLASNITLAVGTMALSLGVPLGCISMAFLGPFGVLVAVAAATAGAALIMLAQHKRAQT